MRKTIILFAALALTLLIPTVAGAPVDESGKGFPLASPINITSPSNSTYSDRLLTLNVTVRVMLSATSISISYGVDREDNVTIHLTSVPDAYGSGLVSTVTGLVTLPELPNGPHSLTVYAKYDYNNQGAPHVATDNATVYFAISDNTSPITSNQSANSWVEKAPMHTPRYKAGVVVVNGIIYAIGGRHSQVNGIEGTTVATNATEAYDPSTNIWAEKASMPAPMDSFGVAVYQNRIFAIGGDKNFVYDPATDTWTTKTPMPTPRTNVQANVVTGKIYLIGGGGQQNGNLNEVYDPATDSWNTKTPIPTAVYGYASAVVDNKIYVISGNTGDLTITNLIQIYDPQTETWSSGAPIPMGVSNAAAGVTTGAYAPKAIYVMGGANATYPLNGQYVNQVYSPETNSWSTAASMPIDRAGLSVAVINDTLYAIGGGHNIFTPDSTDIRQFTPIGYEPSFASPSPSPSTPLSPAPTPNPSPSPSTSPTTSPSQSPSPTPTSFSSPSASPILTASPSPPTSAPPSQSPEPSSTPILSTEYIIATAATVAIIGIVAASILRKRGNKKQNKIQQFTVRIRRLSRLVPPDP
jgi:N-acetylneuraminic acid mutarotase